MMSQKLQAVFDGKTPYGWQLDAAEALVLELMVSPRAWRVLNTFANKPQLLK